MTQVIAVSKGSNDVLTATNPDDLTYSSDYNTLKYYAEGSVTLNGSVPFGSTSAVYGTLVHGLGYCPYNQVEITSNQDPNRYYQNSYYDVGAGAITFHASASCGTGNLIFLLYLENFSGGTLYGTATYHYKLFRNNLGF